MTDIKPGGTPPAAAQARHGLSARTVAEIRECLQGFPEIHWIKLYGSRAMGSRHPGSHINLALSSERDCSATLRDHIARVGIPLS